MSPLSLLDDNSSQSRTGHGELKSGVIAAILDNPWRLFQTFHPRHLKQIHGHRPFAWEFTKPLKTKAPIDFTADGTWLANGET